LDDGNAFDFSKVLVKGLEKRPARLKSAASNLAIRFFPVSARTASAVLLDPSMPAELSKNKPRLTD
jgi:hypothetical protein